MIVGLRVPPCTIRNASDGAPAVVTVLPRDVLPRVGSSAGPAPVSAAVATLSSACLCSVGVLKLADSTSKYVDVVLAVAVPMLPVKTGG